MDKMRSFVTLLLAATTAHAHYTFPRLVVDGQPEAADWSATRITKNAQSKQGIENPTMADIRCYQQRNAAEVATVPAGSMVSYISTQQVNHPGPTQYYLARVPDGADVRTWDGSGSVWFKFHTEMLSMDRNKQLVWPGQNEYRTVNATVPLQTPPGDYLLLVEHIALHMASSLNKAQFYLACSQVRVTGDGTGLPGPLVALPGAYESRDPGILVNLARIDADSYVPPGPPVWTGA